MCWCEPCMATQHIKWQLIKMRGEKKTWNQKWIHITATNQARREQFFFFRCLFSVCGWGFSHGENVATSHTSFLLSAVWFDVSFSKAIKLKPNWWFLLMIFYLENTLFFLLSTLLLGCATFRLNGSIHFSACALHWIRFSENIFRFREERVLTYFVLSQQIIFCAHKFYFRIIERLWRKCPIKKDTRRTMWRMNWCCESGTGGAMNTGLAQTARRIRNLFLFFDELFREQRHAGEILSQALSA